MRYMNMENIEGLQNLDYLSASLEAIKWLTPHIGSGYAIMNYDFGARSSGG